MRAGGFPRAVSVRPFSVWLGRRDGVLDRFRDRPGERITWLFVPYYLSTRLSLSSSLSGRTLQELCLVATSLQLVEGSQQNLWAKTPPTAPKFVRSCLPQCSDWEAMQRGPIQMRPRRSRTGQPRKQDQEATRPPTQEEDHHHQAERGLHGSVVRNRRLE